jgi:hypothetical protein
MKVGPFALLPSSIAVHPAPIEEWEKAAEQLVYMQKSIPWWVGDMVVFGEATWGDDFWSIVPMDASLSMLERHAGVARKYPPNQRNAALSYTHHVIALSIKDPIVRRSVLRHAEREGMDCDTFRAFISERTNG